MSVWTAASVEANVELVEIWISVSGRLSVALGTGRPDANVKCGVAPSRPQ